jgi:hypothetical protein
MAGEQHGDARRGALFENLAHVVDAAWVEAGERLVQHQQLGVVHQGDGELGALLVAMREGVDPRVLAAGQAETADPVRGRLLRGPVVHVMQRGEVPDLLGELHGRVETTFLRHVAELPPGLLVDRLAAGGPRQAGPR